MVLFICDPLSFTVTMEVYECEGINALHLMHMLIEYFDIDVCIMRSV